VAERQIPSGPAAGGRRPAPVLITMIGGRDPDAALGGVERPVRQPGFVVTMVLLRCAFSDRFGEMG